MALPLAKHKSAIPLVRSTTSLDMLPINDARPSSLSSFHSEPMHRQEDALILLGAGEAHDSDDSLTSLQCHNTAAHRFAASPTGRSELASPPTSEVKYIDDSSDEEHDIATDNDHGVKIAGTDKFLPSPDDVDASNAQSRYPPEACAFIANLPKNVADDIITACLSQVYGRDGPIFQDLPDQGECWVILRRNHANANPFAFVQYKTVEEAKLAIEQGPSHSICGRPMRTEAPRAMRSLYISRNDQAALTKAEVKEFLHDYRLTAIETPTNSERQLFGLPHGHWVTFRLYGEAKEALHALRSNDTYHIQFRNTHASSDTPERPRLLGGRFRSGGSVQSATPHHRAGPQSHGRYSRSPRYQSHNQRHHFNDGQDDLWRNDGRSVYHGAGYNGFVNGFSRGNTAGNFDQQRGAVRPVYPSLNSGHPQAVQRYFHPSPITHRMRAMSIAPVGADLGQLQTLYNPNGPSIGPAEHVFDCNCTYCHAKAWHHLRRNSIGLPDDVSRILNAVNPNDCIPNGVHLLEMNFNGLNAPGQDYQITYDDGRGSQSGYTQYDYVSNRFIPASTTQNSAGFSGTVENGGNQK